MNSPVPAPADFAPLGGGAADQLAHCAQLAVRAAVARDQLLHHCRRLGLSLSELAVASGLHRNQVVRILDRPEPETLPTPGPESEHRHNWATDPRGRDDHRRLLLRCIDSPASRFTPELHGCGAVKAFGS